MLFGEEPEKDMAAISFMTDSDSTGTSAEAYFADFVIGLAEQTGGSKEDAPQMSGNKVGVKKKAIVVENKTEEESHQIP